MNQLQAFCDIVPEYSFEDATTYDPIFLHQLLSYSKLPQQNSQQYLQFFSNINIRLPTPSSKFRTSIIKLDTLFSSNSFGMFEYLRQNSIPIPYDFFSEYFTSTNLQLRLACERLIIF